MPSRLSTGRSNSRAPASGWSLRGRGGSFGGCAAFQANDRSRRYAIRARSPWPSASRSASRGPRTRRAMARATPSRGGPARERKRTRARGWRSLERRHDLLRDELELAHDVPVRHAGEEQAADQVVHPVLLDEWLEVPDHLVGIADEE